MKITFDSCTSNQDYVRYLHFDTKVSSIASLRCIFPRFFLLSVYSLRYFFHFDSFTSNKKSASIISLRLKVSCRFFHFDTKISRRFIHFDRNLIFSKVALRYFYFTSMLHFDLLCTSILYLRDVSMGMGRSAILVEVHSSKCENAYMYRSACQPPP